MVGEIERVWLCPDCGVEKVKENRGSYSKTYERFTDRDLFYAHRNCTHSRVFCQDCGRPLTADESVDRKRGPVCNHKRIVLAQTLASQGAVN